MLVERSLTLNNVTTWIAFTAGILSFFSPCIFPLIPAYVANMTDSMVKENKVIVSKKVVFSRSILFIAGFSLIFMLMGASASLIGQIITENRSLVEKVSGILIILFGLQTAGLLHFRFLMFERRLEVKKNKSANGWRSFLLGLAFGSGWIPCVGLALSSILLLAGSTETVYRGLNLLFVFSMGLGIPFLIISFVITQTISIIKKINRFLPLLSKINGFVLIGMGFLLFTGQLQKLSAWLSSFTIFYF